MSYRRVQKENGIDEYNGPVTRYGPQSVNAGIVVSTGVSLPPLLFLFSAGNEIDHET